MEEMVRQTDQIINFTREINRRITESGLSGVDGLVAVASTFIGCAGSGGGSGGGGNPCACKPPATPTVLLSTNVQPILNRSCALAGCHAGAVPAQGQDLSAGHTVSSSVCVKSTEIPRLYRIQ